MQLFPVSVLLGTVLGLGVLANTRELTIMRLAGLSPGKLIIIIMKLVFGLSLLVLVLGETIAPNLDHKAENYKSVSRAGDEMIQLVEGVVIALVIACEQITVAISGQSHGKTKTLADCFEGVAARIVGSRSARR